jgi:hypothetical protein
MAVVKLVAARFRVVASDAKGFLKKAPQKSGCFKKASPKFKDFLGTFF